MAGFDIFLKLDGIDGESTTKGHEKEIEVVSYDQSIDSTVPTWRWWWRRRWQVDVFRRALPQAARHRLNPHRAGMCIRPPYRKRAFRVPACQQHPI